MKFLVLALCVCAASAATLGPNKPSGYKPFSGFNAAAKTASRFAAPVVTPFAKASAVAYKPAQQVATSVVAVPEVAAAAVYEPAKQVVSKTYSVSKDAEAAIVRSDSEVNAEGYQYSYETDNGISGQATGALKQLGEEVVLVSQGTYSYTDPEGRLISVTYVADENGYQPQSDILPVGPEIPEAIARSLVYIAAHPPAVQN